MQEVRVKGFPQNGRFLSVLHFLIHTPGTLTCTSTYTYTPFIPDLSTRMYQGSAQNGVEWWPNKSRIEPQLPESAYVYIDTCKSGGYLPVSGGQLALVMVQVTTMNHCGQNTDAYTTNSQTA